MKAKPISNSELETECLFGETVEVLDNYLEYLYCKLLTDNYQGWIKKNDLGKLDKVSHRVIAKRTFLFENKNIKSRCIDYLPLGAKLSIKEVGVNWAKVLLSDNHKKKIAYVPTKHIVTDDHKLNDWVSVCESLLETPYKWGGRDTIGLDCSALLQLSYQTYGYKIPRNTRDQLKLQKKVVKDINKLDRGFVVFWRGHVGIMVDSVNCIHANAFHMKTVIEPIIEIIKRMGKNYQIIKMMNFN